MNKKIMNKIINEWKIFSHLTINKDIDSEDRRMLYQKYLQHKKPKKYKNETTKQKIIMMMKK